MKGLLKLMRAEWERSLGVALIVAGIATFIGGYAGVKGTHYLSVQMSYLTSGGIGGLFLLGLGGVLIVAAGLHDEWRKLDDIVNRLDSGATPTVANEIIVDDGVTSSISPVGDGAGRLAPTATLAVARDAVAVRSAQQTLIVAGIGAMALVAGWMQSKSGTRIDAALRAPVVAGLGVALALALGASRLVQLQGLVAGRKHSVLRFLAPAEPMVATGPAVPESVADRDGRMYRASSQREVHRQGCPTLANAAAVVEVTRPATDADPCRLCRPFENT